MIRTYYLSICVLFLSHNWTYCIYKPICSSQRCAQRYISQADNPRKKWSSSSENVKMLQRFGDGEKDRSLHPPHHLQLTTQLRDKRTSKDYARNRQVTHPGGEAIVDARPENKASKGIYLKHLFSGSIVCWPFLQMCHPFIDFWKISRVRTRRPCMAARRTITEKTVHYWVLSKKYPKDALPYTAHTF